MEDTELYQLHEKHEILHKILLFALDPVTPQCADSISLDSDITFDSGNTGSTQSKEMIR